MPGANLTAILTWLFVSSASHCLVGPDPLTARTNRPSKGDRCSPGYMDGCCALDCSGSAAPRGQHSGQDDRRLARAGQDGEGGAGHHRGRAAPYRMEAQLSIMVASCSQWKRVATMVTL